MKQKIFLKSIPKIDNIIKNTIEYCEKANNFINHFHKWYYLIYMFDTTTNNKRLWKSENFFTFERCYVDFISCLTLFKRSEYVIDDEIFVYERLNKKGGFDINYTHSTNGNLALNNTISDLGVDSATYSNIVLKTKLFIVLFEHICCKFDIGLHPIFYYYEVFDNEYKSIINDPDKKSEKYNIYIRKNNKNADTITRYIHCKFIDMIKKYGDPFDSFFEDITVTDIHDLLLNKKYRLIQLMNQIREFDGKLTNPKKNTQNCDENRVQKEIR